MSIKAGLKAVLVRHADKQYHKRLKRAEDQLKLQSISFSAVDLSPEGNDVKSGFTDLKDGTGKIAFYARNPENIMPGAIGEIEDYFARHKDAVLLYSDTGIKNKGYAEGFFKPNWSPDRFLSNNYIGGFFAFRESALPQGYKIPENGDTDGAFKLFHEIAKNSGGFEKRNKETILHLPKILYTEESVECFDEYREAARKNAPAMGSPEHARVSALILTKDHPALVKTCVTSLKKCSASVDLEIIVLDNGSSDTNRRETEAFLESNGARYVYDPCEFNFSKLCNKAAGLATGDYFLFCNDDIEFTDERTVYELLLTASLPYVGECGCKLYYPGGDVIQHAGINNVFPGPMHKLQNRSDSEVYNYGFNRSAVDLLAVTAALVMVAKEKFFEAGGFPEDMKVAFNDVALGFALHDLGFYNVCRNDFSCIHHESATRGHDELSVDKTARLIDERNLLYSKYKDHRGKDPYLSEMLDNITLDWAFNTRFIDRDDMPVAPAEAGHASDLYRNDDKVLFLGMEYFGREADFEVHREGYLEAPDTLYRIYGYAFVNGYDNAGVSHRVVLSSGDIAYTLKCAQIFRPDVARNVPDQTNVAFSGFGALFDTKRMNAGTYRVLIMAEDRYSRLKLVRDTGRRLTIR